MKNDFEPEALLRVLQRIAGDCGSDSEEYLSIEIAAKAILFIHATGQQVAFRTYMGELKQDLTETERRFLSSIGLEDVPK